MTIKHEMTQEQHEAQIRSLPMLVPAKIAIEFLGIPKSSFYAALAKDPDFPKPKKTVRSKAYWLRRDLLEFVEEA